MIDKKRTSPKLTKALRDLLADDSPKLNCIECGRLQSDDLMLSGAGPLCFDCHAEEEAKYEGWDYEHGSGDA